MKVLVDEDLPERLRLFLTDHEVFTVRYMGWKGLKNGALTRTAEASEFNVLITGDRNPIEQQSIKDKRLGVVVLSAQKIGELLPHVREIDEAVLAIRPGTIRFVKCGVER